MVNDVTLIGNLGKDPEVRQTQGGQAVCNFSVATAEKWKDKNGEDQEQTEWHRIVTWGKLAEVCGKYLEKGKQIYIRGKIQTREWEKDGEKRYSTEIVAREVKFLGRKGEGGGSGDVDSGSTGSGPTGSRPTGSSSTGSGTGGWGKHPSEPDEDLPF